MRFGLTDQQRLKRLEEARLCQSQAEARGEDHRRETGEWRPWFAWRPVRTNQGWIWFEHIESKLLWRRDFHVPLFGSCGHAWRAKRYYRASPR